jgi:hypothetical protein
MNKTRNWKDAAMSGKPRKTKSNQDIQCSGQDSKSEPPEEKSGLLNLNQLVRSYKPFVTLYFSILLQLFVHFYAFYHLQNIVIHA